MMSAVATKTMQSVQKAANASVFSELMATAFQNFVQLLKKHPAFFSLPNQGGVDVQGLFSCACFCIRLPEAGAVKYATSYLTHLISASATQPGSSNPALANTVRGAGATMLREAISVAVNNSPTSDVVEQLSAIFFYLSKYYFEELCRWLEEVVKQAGFPGPAITEDKKREFATNLVQSRGNKRKVLDSLKDFIATCISIQGRK